MSYKNLSIVFILSVGFVVASCKPLRDPEGFSRLSATETGDQTGRFLPETKEIQRSEVEMVMNQLETVAKQKASSAISSGDATKIDVAMAEWMSVRHQRDVLQSLDPAKNQSLYNELGMSVDAVQGMREGILDSDKGKLAEYQKLLVEESVRSNKLFDTLRLDDAGSVKPETLKEFKKILIEMRFKSGKGILNPETTNAEFRKLITENAVLKGYLHDLPGLVDAVELREKGIITAERFRERVKANLFHNGPDAGFWAKLKGFFSANKTLVSKMFKGSVFIDSKGKLTYPGSRSVGGMLHRMVDRVSQATRGGLLKIVFETRFLPSNRAIAELALESPGLTIEQLEASKADINKAAKDGVITKSQAAKLIEKTGQAIGRVENHGKLLSARIKGAEAIKSKLKDAKYAPEKIQVVSETGVVETLDSTKRNGKVFVPDEILVELIEATDPVSKKLYEQVTDVNNVDKGLKAMDRAAQSIEAKGIVGDPMRPVSEPSMATQNVIERSVVQARERTLAAQEARSAAAEQLSNRFNNNQRQAANQQAEVIKNTRQVTTFDVQNVESFTRRPGRSQVINLKFQFNKIIEADPELKEQFRELERLATEHEALREKIRSGKAQSSATAQQYKSSVARVVEIRTKVVNSIRAKAARAIR
ncbi:hypothetical protein N9D31_03445 [Oligoflexaceae bacterium]|nr:hypothetical protein [Oligoflexaceae bacterium]